VLNLIKKQWKVCISVLVRWSTWVYVRNCHMVAVKFGRKKQGQVATQVCWCEKAEGKRDKFVLEEVGQNDWTWVCDMY
jgi:hypothetical protein